MPTVCGGECELIFQTNTEFSFIAKESEWPIIYFKKYGTLKFGFGKDVQLGWFEIWVIHWIQIFEQNVTQCTNRTEFYPILTKLYLNHGIIVSLRPHALRPRY